MQPSDEDDDDVQAIRLTSQDRTIHITTHQDPSLGKIIVLWNDVLRVFPDALYLQLIGHLASLRSRALS
ncbi:hypothetical protein BGZ90_006474 [Linnemannia elongata]|nr:hypothetical protein BGZ90_006474 [Linnemannia elongata]